MISPTAFISYAWESDEHKAWVRQFAARLRSDGIAVSLDQWELAPGDQLPAFMEKAVRENQFVLVICTPTYKRKSDARQGGSGYEGDIMTAEVLYSANNRKFIPILRQGTWQEAAPSWMLGKLYLDLKGNPYNERHYIDLIRTIHNKREQAPPVGAPPRLENESLEAAAQSGLCLHLSEREIEALDYAPNQALIHFSVTNLTGEIVKLTGLKLCVLEKKKIRKVRLPKVGAPFTEYRINADLSEGPEVDLLANIGAQFLLKPEDSDAFEINASADQGYQYSLMLSGEGETISRKWSGTFESTVVYVTYPIRTQRGLTTHGSQT
jgi:hypothetical protein